MLGLRGHQCRSASGLLLMHPPGIEPRISAWQEKGVTTRPSGISRDGRWKSATLTSFFHTVPAVLAEPEPREPYDFV